MSGEVEGLIYYHSVLCSATIILFIGCHLIFGRLPDRLRGTIYQRSRILMGCASLVLFADLALVSIFLPRDGNIHLSVAISLSSYYAVVTLISLSLVPLLFNRSFLSKRRVAYTTAGFLLYVSLMWLAVIFGNEVTKHTILAIAIALFLIYLGYYVVMFFKRYWRVSRYSENFYSDSIELKWTARSVVYMVIMGLLGGIMVYADDIIMSIFMLYVLFVFSYTYARFINYVIYSEDVAAMNEVISEDDTNEAIKCDEDCEVRNMALRADVHIFIEKKIAYWINARYYINKGINIQEMAIQIGTNRTYLSSYINATHQCTFRDWITDLRLEESRRLIINGDKHTISEIAEQVGFSSPAAYTRAFTRRYSEPPSRWREHAHKG